MREKESSGPSVNCLLNNRLFLLENEDDREDEEETKTRPIDIYFGSSWAEFFVSILFILCPSFSFYFYK